MNVDIWEHEEFAEALAVCDRLLAGGRGVEIWAAAADTNREWDGADDDLKASDIRVRMKNGREYHGMEEYAWQYFVAAQFSGASDWFYVTAVWRVEDMTAVLDENPGHTPDRGHVFAIETCVRMARFARGLAAARAAGTVTPRPGDCGLVEAKIRRGEARILRNIDRVLASLGRAAPSNPDGVRRSAADLKRLTADGRA